MSCITGTCTVLNIGRTATQWSRLGTAPVVHCSRHCGNPVGLSKILRFVGFVISSSTAVYYVRTENVSHEHFGSDWFWLPFALILVLYRDKLRAQCNSGERANMRGFQWWICLLRIPSSVSLFLILFFSAHRLYLFFCFPEHGMVPDTFSDTLVANPVAAKKRKNQEPCFRDMMCCNFGQLFSRAWLWRVAMVTSNRGQHFRHKWMLFLQRG